MMRATIGVARRIPRVLCSRYPMSAGFSTSSPVADESTERESMAFDVLIVGGGPAGLAASIRLKQLCMEQNKELSICLIDKGSEIGSHILSGNVFDPKAMHELFPDKKETWTSELLDSQTSHATPVQHDQFHILTSPTSNSTIPHFLLPPQLHNKGNYILSLSQLCRWLASQAEELGVEIYPGFAANELLYTTDDKGQPAGVYGIATKDVGVGKDGEPKATFERGMELQARQTLLAEGARGSCSEELMETFGLRDSPDVQPQTYGLGVKEVWEIPEEKHQPGLVMHSLGWPLQSSLTSQVFGGSFLYHQEPNLVLLGMVVGLDYANPYLNPYQEFQQWKTHPAISSHLEGGACVSYGARVLNEGGYHAIPHLTAPGASMIGCAAGFLNAVKIKGTHTAMKSGMLAAEACFDALTSDGDSSAVAETGELNLQENPPVELTSYPEKIKQSWIHDELYAVRNSHEAFARWGVGGGVMYTGLTTLLRINGREPWTLAHSASDADKTKPKEYFEPINYPAPDGKLTFDLLTNLQRSNTYHEEDQPSHLRIKPALAHVPVDLSMQVFAGPEQRFCPAGVYEYPGDGPPKLTVNFTNCLHCKTCSIKMPHEYVQWTVPEGGGGPQYQVM